MHSQIQQGAIAEEAKRIAASVETKSAASVIEELPEIYRRVDVDFWAELNDDQLEAVRRMQKSYAEHAAHQARGIEEVDDALIALHTPRLVAGGFMMGAGFLGTALSMLDVLGPLLLYLALPVGIFGVVLSLDNRN